MSTKNLSQRLDEVKEEHKTALLHAKTEIDVEAIRVAFLGRKGIIANLMEQLKDLSIEEKKIFFIILFIFIL